MVLEKMVETDSLREKTLEVAKRHKASWIELGQYLYTIYKDKYYKAWDYLTFEGYCAKELHLKQTTAMKLLKSYYFLEKEKPELVKASANGEFPKTVPNYESVNVLRLASGNKNLNASDIHDIRKAVFESGKEPKEVKTQVRRLLSEREEKDPSEIRKDKRNSMIRRLISTLKNSKKELESDQLLPAYLVKQMEELAVKLEDQLE